MVRKTVMFFLLFAGLFLLLLRAGICLHSFVNFVPSFQLSKIKEVK